MEQVSPEYHYKMAHTFRDMATAQFDDSLKTNLLLNAILHAVLALYRSEEEDD